MKKNLLYIIMLLSFSAYAQTLTDKQSTKLNEFNIKFDKIDLNNISIQDDLNKILKLDKKRKTNKTVAIILSSIAVTGIALGGIVIASGNKEGSALSSAVGGLAIAGGVIYGGVSIPFWISSNKRKKERNKLIDLYD